jgi:amino-acid N-acetyltransferase
MPETPKLSRTNDINRLNLFFATNGLESAEEAFDDEQYIAAWTATDPETNNLVGALSLVRRKGYYIIDGIAVDQAFRKQGLGRILIDLALAEARSLKINEVYLVAKVPLFFRKLGFLEIPWPDAPPVFECTKCPQYNRDCHPEAMFISLNESF